MVIEPLHYSKWFFDGPNIHIMNEPDSFIRFRCSHLIPLFDILNSYGITKQKIVLLINPLWCPLFSTSLKSPEQLQQEAIKPEKENEYATLNAPIPSKQTIELNPAVHLTVPYSRSFLPVCSFVSQEGYTDIPIPSIVDYIVCTRKRINEYKDYSDSLLEPLNQLDCNPELANFDRRQNCLFMRSSCTKNNKVYNLIKSYIAMDSTTKHFYDLGVSKPVGILEIIGNTIDCVPDNSCRPCYISQGSSFNYHNMFSTLLNCRYALVVPDVPEMMFLPLYLLTKTIVFMVESPYRYWWSSYLQPNIHYIPIKSDLSDLNSKFSECCNNPSAYKQIAMNGYTLGSMLFNRNTLGSYMQDIYSMLFRLPMYKQLNTLYAGGNTNSFEAPDLEYYKLLFVNQYPFGSVKREESCDCSVCTVSMYNLF